MFIYPPFNFPFFYNNYKHSQNNSITNNYNHLNKTNLEYFTSKNKYKEKAPELNEAPEAFFEIFGLKLYFDDILIICIIFFLYSENVQNQELFICLILLLLS